MRCRHVEEWRSCTKDQLSNAALHNCPTRPYLRLLPAYVSAEVPVVTDTIASLPRISPVSYLQPGRYPKPRVNTRSNQPLRMAGGPNHQSGNWRMTRSARATLSCSMRMSTDVVPPLVGGGLLAADAQVLRVGASGEAASVGDCLEAGRVQIAHLDLNWGRVHLGRKGRGASPASISWARM